MSDKIKFGYNLDNGTITLIKNGVQVTLTTEQAFDAFTKWGGNHQIPSEIKDGE